MPKPIDATTKTLLKAGPDAWVALVGVAVDGPTTALDTDVSTVTAAVDGVCRVDGPDPWLVHFEFQSSADSTLPQRLWRYNVLLDDRHGVPVLTVAVLLRPKADGPSLRGIHERRLPQGGLCHLFHYAVVRVWEIPVQRLLNGGLSTLPLALISDLGQTSIEDVATEVQRRIETEAGRTRLPNTGRRRLCSRRSGWDPMSVRGFSGEVWGWTCSKTPGSSIGSARRSSRK